MPSSPAAGSRAIIENVPSAARSSSKAMVPLDVITRSNVASNVGFARIEHSAMTRCPQQPSDPSVERQFRRLGQRQHDIDLMLDLRIERGRRDRHRIDPLLRQLLGYAGGAERLLRLL